MTIEQMGQDVAALLAHHDLTDAVLVGHSMGCRVIIGKHVGKPRTASGDWS